MISNRSSKGMNALFMALMVSHWMSAQLKPNSSTSCITSWVIEVALIRRLSVLTVTRKRRSLNTLMGCSAMDAAAPVWTLDVGHSSRGMRRSRTKAASRPSLGVPSGPNSMSSTMRTPWPSRSVPQYCTASQMDGGP